MSELHALKTMLLILFESKFGPLNEDIRSLIINASSKNINAIIREGGKATRIEDLDSLISRKKKKSDMLERIKGLICK
jgi:hypothetical protein